MGNVVTDTRSGTVYGYTYNSAGRLSALSVGGVATATYRYDAMGRQATRTLVPSGVTIHSVFDSQGRRIAEYTESTGALIREYVWMGWDPIAVIVKRHRGSFHSQGPGYRGKTPPVPAACRRSASGSVRGETGGPSRRCVGTGSAQTTRRPATPAHRHHRRIPGDLEDAPGGPRGPWLRQKPSPRTRRRKCAA
jgi:hypothetical protein